MLFCVSNHRNREKSISESRDTADILNFECLGYLIKYARVIAPNGNDIFQMFEVMNTVQP